MTHIPDCPTGRRGLLASIGHPDQPFDVTVLDRQPGCTCAHGSQGPLYNMYAIINEECLLILSCLCNVQLEDLA